jgi:hypothetical protein
LSGERITALHMFAIEATKASLRHPSIPPELHLDRPWKHVSIASGTGQSNQGQIDLRFLCHGVTTEVRSDCLIYRENRSAPWSAASCTITVTPNGITGELWAMAVRLVDDQLVVEITSAEEILAQQQEYDIRDYVESGRGDGDRVLNRLLLEEAEIQLAYFAKNYPERAQALAEEFNLEIIALP